MQHCSKVITFHDQFFAVHVYNLSRRIQFINNVLHKAFKLKVFKNLNQILPELPLANKIRLLAKLMALARMGIYKMDMLNKKFLMSCRKCFVYCKSLCLSNFSNIFHWRPSLIRSGRFSHLPPNVKMTLSMATIVLALPLKGHNIRNTWSFHRRRIQWDTTQRRT